MLGMTMEIQIATQKIIQILTCVISGYQMIQKKKRKEKKNEIEGKEIDKRTQTKIVSKKTVDMREGEFEGRLY